jgi:hypothetical protein
MDCRQRGPRLPNITLIFGAESQAILRKGEIIHCAVPAAVLEQRTVGQGYRGGLRGVSVAVGHGFRVRVRSSRGRHVRDVGWVVTSSGLLVLTNLQLFLYPAGAAKPVSLPLN